MMTREIFSPENPTIPACQVRASDIAEDLFVAPTVIEVQDDDTGNVPDEVSEHNSTTKAERLVLEVLPRLSGTKRMLGGRQLLSTTRMLILPTSQSAQVIGLYTKMESYL